MTTSRGGALTPSLYAETPAEQKSLQEYLKIQEELEAALTNRQRLFDPVLLAMAQGFLAPTKTGKFGESIGNVAAAVGPVQEAEEKRRLENIAMRRDLAAAKLGAQQSARDEEMMRGLLRPPGAAPAAGQAPTAPPAASELAQTPAAAGAAPAPQVGTPLAPRPAEAAVAPAQTTPAATEGATIDRFTPDQLSAMAISNNPRVQALGKAILSIREDQRKNITVVGGNLVDMRNNRVLFRAPEKEEQFTFPGIEGSFPMTPLQAEKIRTEIGGMPAGPARDARLRELLRGLQSREDIEARGELLKGRAKSASAEEETIMKAGSLSNQLRASAETLLDLSTNPRTKGGFGVIADQGILNAIAGAVQTGLTTPGGSIGFGGIDDAVAKLKGTPEQIAARRLAAREQAMLELNYRRAYLEGQGSVSNMEGEVTRLLGPSISDTPEAAAAKARLIIARAEFDKTVRSEWINARKRGESVYEFKESDTYKNALKELDDKAKVIRDDLIAQAARKPGGSAAGQAPTQRPAERKMPDGSTWVLQPDGSYKAKK
jgi:hypothetical protein